MSGGPFFPWPDAMGTAISPTPPLHAIIALLVPHSSLLTTTLVPASIFNSAQHQNIQYLTDYIHIRRSSLPLPSSDPLESSPSILSYHRYWNYWIGNAREKSVRCSTRSRNKNLWLKLIYLKIPCSRKLQNDLRKL